MARPRKLTPELAARIVAFVRGASRPLHAARACGIHPRTWRRWTRLGREGRDAECVALVSSIAEAEAVSMAALAATVRTAAQADWRASAWLLERRWPKLWSKRGPEYIDVQEAPARPLTDEDRERLRRIISLGEERVAREAAAGAGGGADPSEGTSAG